MKSSAICFVLILTAGPAFAQSAWEDRVTIRIGGGIQPGTAGMSESLSLSKNVEAMPVAASLTKKGVPLVEGGAMVRLIGNVGVEVSLSYLSRKDSADVAAQIPHPFFFNQPRGVSGRVSGIQHSELVTHTDLLYVLVFDRLEVALSGGASFFDISQDLVSDVIPTETYPYDTATFASASTTHVSVRRIGYNAGVDGIWKLSRRFGAGALFRYARASVPLGLDVNGVSVTAETINAGGLQASAGLRVSF